MNWVEEAKKLPVAFAQVREDALLDIEVVNQFAPKRAKVLMVASGGCTACALIPSCSIQELYIVDPNPYQIHLTQVKLHLLEKPMEDRIEPLLYLEQGRYESLFAELRKELAPFADEIRELFDCDSITKQQELISLDTKLWKAIEHAFDKVMALDNLIALFGTEATQNPAMDFSRHFALRTRHVLTTQKANESPYLAQMLLGSFYNDVYYPWMTMRIKGIPKMIWANERMQSVLEQAPTNFFDVIHLSNILDWLSEVEAQRTLQLVHKALKPHGVFILRQLNSHLDIEHLGSQFTYLTNEAKQLHEKDRSFFYRALYLCIK
jgi:S-adenosylmethionine-diacylglycerol 3-amino-3-carboxypropyl transferase